MDSRRLIKLAWWLSLWALVGRAGTDLADTVETPRDVAPERAAVSPEAKPGVPARPMAPPGERRNAPSGTTAEAADQPPKAVIEELNHTLLEAMKRAGELGYRGRYRLLEPVIRRAFDFRAISRYVLGSHWKRLSSEQKTLFIEKMTRYGIATYASQFDDYGGEQFEILSDAPFRERFRVVKTVLKAPGEEDIEFVYILRRTRDGWKIIDVRYDGVSDLALKRGQFMEILEKDGFDALLSKLDKKIADYARENATQAG